MRSQHPSIEALLRLGFSKLKFCKRSEKFGQSVVFGLFLLTLVFLLTGCQGFMDDYSYRPVAGMLPNSNQ